METSPLKISVLIPVYNEERYLRQCIDSILAQTDAAFEICISDNASTDGTWELICSYQARDEPILAYRQASLVHPYDNLRQTLQMATGDYICFIGGDDYLLPGFFREGLRNFATFPKLVGHLATMTYFDDATGDPIVILPPTEFESAINDSNGSLIRFVLKQINHDELILGIFRKDEFASAVKMTSASSYEPTGIWLFLNTIIAAEDPYQRVKIALSASLMKRNRKLVATSYSRSVALAEGVLCRSYREWIGSIGNVVRLRRSKLIRIPDVLLLLFGMRYSTNKYTPHDSSVRWQLLGPVFGFPLNSLVVLGRRLLVRVGAEIRTRGLTLTPIFRRARIMVCGARIARPRGRSSGGVDAE